METSAVSDTTQVELFLSGATMRVPFAKLRPLQMLADSIELSNDASGQIQVDLSYVSFTTMYAAIAFSSIILDAKPSSAPTPSSTTASTPSTKPNAILGVDTKDAKNTKVKKLMDDPAFKTVKFINAKVNFFKMFQCISNDLLVFALWQGFDELLEVMTEHHQHMINTCRVEELSKRYGQGSCFDKKTVEDTLSSVMGADARAYVNFTA